MPSALETELPAEPSLLREWRVVVIALLMALLPVAVLFAVHGYSCGHDLPFHLGSWQDAAQQLGHGGWPQWDFLAAHSAGEPRFVFYPPLSWLLGAGLLGIGLRTLMSPEHAAMVFVLLAAGCCWLTMFSAARRYTTAAGAIVAATLYALGPYALLNALERSAFAELLAMAWLPLLFVAVMRERTSVVRIAVPVALLWLTNVPTAIIGSYLVVLLGAVRLYGDWDRARVAKFVAGVGIGIGLAGFFLVPAVHEQAAVQINGAFSEGQTYGDNFLLRHSEHTRRGVIHEISLITAEELAALSALLGVVGWVRGTLTPEERRMLAAVTASAAAVLFLMLPWSALLWAHLPKLSVLQFPWRLLCVLSLTVALAAAIGLRTLLTSRVMGVAVALVLAIVLGWSGFWQFWLDPQGRENDGVVRAQMLQMVERRATSEYTPVGAENDTLRAGAAAYAPGYWLQRESTGVAGGNGRGDTVNDVQPLTHAGGDAVAPGHLALELAQAEVLVLDLRAYPQWHVKRNGSAVALQPRADGLIALALPAGGSVVDVVWVDGWDRWVGAGVSALALCLLLVSIRRSRKLLYLESITKCPGDSTP
jgi:hypothetical protein